MGMSSTYSKIGAAEARSMEQVMRELLEGRMPAISIANVIERGMSPQATAFEQYASMVLRSAGGLRLSSIPGSNRMRISRPENGHLAHFATPSQFPQGIEPTLLSVECSLNRLVCIVDAISDGKTSAGNGDKALRQSISILGGGYLSDDIGWRSTMVELPCVESISNVSTDYYNEVDWRVADNVASSARAIFHQCIRPNPYRTIFGISSRDRSDWDVRTRLAQIIDALELPYRYSFRFDYDHSTSTVAALFTCPPEKSLPSFIGLEEQDTDQIRFHAYESYLLRLACLFGAVCFGSGRDVASAIIAGYDASWKRPLVSAYFDRDAFARSVLTSIDDGSFSNPALRFDPESISKLIDAENLDWICRTGTDEDYGVADLSLELPSRIIPPWKDTRPMSDDAQDFFRCVRICDTDTLHYHGGNADAIDLAWNDAEESSLSAVMRLEALVDDIESNLQPPEDSEGSRPLFAPHPLARLAVQLLDNDLSIAEQAEAFLVEKTDIVVISTPNPRFFRAPNALFHARMGLSDLYQTMGDLNAAALQADRCIALAPTAVNAYYRKADVLAEQGKYSEAANVLIAGLLCATTSVDSALLYYHLGMLFWNMGMKWEAATVHVYNASLSGEHADRSGKVVKGLRRQKDAPSISNEPPLEALRELERLGIPIAPVNMRERIARAVVLLTNAGTPQAAAPFACELERLSGDEVIKTACRSIQFGIEF